MFKLLRKPKEQAFTIIELIVVVLIVGVLAAIAIPIYLGVQTQAKQSGLRSDVYHTVQKASIALTTGQATVSDILANKSKYIVKSNSAENIDITYSEKADTFLSTSFTGNTSATMNDGLYHGRINGAFNAGYSNSSAPTIMEAADSLSAQDYFSIVGTIGSGANVSYTYGYDSYDEKYTGDPVDGKPTHAVAPTVLTTTLPDTVKGDYYTTTILTAGKPTPAFTITGLPTGLAYDAATGAVTGVASTSGNYIIHVSATNSAGTKTADLALTVNQRPTITSGNLPNGNTADSYSFDVTASGSPASTFAITGLPAGLSYDTATGHVSGTPAVSSVGNHTVTVTATNSVGTASKDYTVAIGTKPAITSATTLPDASVGSSYSFVVTASGSPAPGITVTGLGTGNLAGLSYNGTTGTITGIPTTQGSAQVTITATNLAGSASKTYTLTVKPFVPVSILNDTFTSGLPSGYTTPSNCYNVTTTGGSIGVSYCTGGPGLTSGNVSLPAGTYTASASVGLGGTYNASCGVSLTRVSGATPSNSSASSTSCYGDPISFNFTLSAPAVVKLGAYGGYGGYTYQSGSFDNFTIKQTAP